MLNGIENTISGPATVFQVNPTVAARAGFTPEEVAIDAAAILEGEPAATPVITNDRAYTIRVRFPDANRASLAAMSNTLLVSSTGHTATLGSLATVTELPGQTEIRRENLQRDVVVTARLEGRDLGSGIAAVQKAVSRSAHCLPPSAWNTAAPTRSSRNRFTTLMLRSRARRRAGLRRAAVRVPHLRRAARDSGFGAAVDLGSLPRPAGHRDTFNISSFMGLIMVIGIVAKNGILLLDADQKFRAVGFSAEDAMIQAGRRRLRPIVMTALAAVAGMLPAGARARRRLADAAAAGHRRHRRHQRSPWCCRSSSPPPYTSTSAMLKEGKSSLEER